MKISKRDARKKNKIRKFEIIKSRFSPEEALELISDIIENKISFHKLKILQSKEYTGKTNKVSEKRIRELSKILRDIKKFCIKQDKTKRVLNVNALLTIEVIDSKE